MLQCGNLDTQEDAHIFRQSSAASWNAVEKMELCGEKIRGNGLQLPWEKCQEDGRRTNHSEDCQAWEEGPREFVKSLSLEIIKGWLHKAPSNLLKVALNIQLWVGDLKRSLPTSSSVIVLF